MAQRSEECSWQDLLEYGRKTGAASGYPEQDVPRLVKVGAASAAAGGNRRHSGFQRSHIALEFGATRLLAWA
jgi:hypothetical protein